VEVEPFEEIVGCLDYSTPLVSRSASPVCGMQVRLSPVTLGGPINSTSETRVVETGVFASAPWPDPSRLSCIASNQET